MSGPATYPDTGKGGSQDGVHVREVRVEFLQNRPRDPLVLVVRLNGKKYEIDIGRGDEVRWSGNVYCPLPSTVQVQIRRNNPFILPGNSLIPLYHASIRAPLSLGLSSISDDLGHIRVTFTISESTVSSRAEAAEEQDRVKRTLSITRQLEEVWSAVTFVHSTVRRTPNDMYSAADLAIRMVALQSLMETCQAQESCSDETMNLVREFVPFLSVNDHAEKLQQRAETRRAVQVMLELIERTSEYILSCTSSRVIGDRFGEEYRLRLSDLKKDFTRAKEAFSRSVGSVVFEALAGVERNMQLSMLHGKLSECERAHFRSEKDSACLEGTRVNLLERIMDWVAEGTSIQPNVFWLRGKAGTGKSTVANTVAQAMQDRGYLLSCFFCKKDDADLSDPRRVLPTLAFRFAQHHESYRAFILPLVHNDLSGVGIATTAGIDTQFQKLFKLPLTHTVDPLRPHVIVIDALDECGSSKQQTSLARYILELPRLAPWIKVFVTSRDDPAISGALATYLCVQCNISDEMGTHDDVRRYIERQANDLQVELSAMEIRQLVTQAEGLFIWCSTLFKYLSKRLGSARRRALEPFLSNQHQHTSLTDLYDLYDKVIDSAVSDEEDRDFMQAILTIANVLARNYPLSAKTITSFLHASGLHQERTEADAQDVFQELHAVIYVDRSTNGAIRACHTSFYDFLDHKATEAAKADGAGPRWERSGVIHGRILRRCIDILNAQLKFNICSIEKPVLNKDILHLSERISANISEELQYSSRFWFIHLTPSNLAQSDVASDVRELLCSRKLLFWLETLSLQGSLMQYSLALATCSSFFQGYLDIVVAANDAHRFITAFSEAMDSVPHIYLSSLFWLPEDSQTYRNLKLSELTHVRLIEGRQSNWDAVIWERSINRKLCCVAHSPDGQYVACGADDGRIYLWDAQTGAQEGQPLQGHSERVSCLAYSPNSQFIASGSWDSTVRIWDARSGVPVFEALIGHTGRVNGVAWSPDRESIASCSENGTIRIWNTRTGTQEGVPFRGHQGCVFAVAFAPDGVHIASGGYDETIRIWRTDTYQEVEPPFRGNLDSVMSVRYSPDGNTIVSGCFDGTIRTWNAQTGEAIGRQLRGHKGSVRSVMYSPNGQLIVSGSGDNTVRVWDALSGTPVGEPLRGHTGWVTSVSFSPDGLSIASVSDDGTICALETPTASRVQEQAQGHDGPVRAVAFSPDGHRIVTGSHDRLVRLWDSGTGAPIGEPLRGHDGMVTSVAYSPDGESIASGSRDKTVRIWNAKTGKAVGEPLRGHSGGVVSVAYSPNGSLIASASWDCTVRLWDARNGRAIFEPLQAGEEALSVAFSPDGRSLACGTDENTVLVWEISSTVSLKMTLRGHSGNVGSVVFSPSGRYIASGSDDDTVQIWDARTGKPLGSPLKGHTGWVYCVAFSPDSRLIASSSDDGTVRLWDVQTGQAVGDPLGGHSRGVLVFSVAFSPDGRSLASAGSDNKISVCTVPSAHLSQTFSETRARARWLECCSRVNEQTGWINDGDSLLLWSPSRYRPVLKLGARILIGKSAPRVIACNVDYETLFRYSGTAWVNVLSDKSSGG